VLDSNLHKHLLILGGGESGVGTAILAQKQGYEVFLSDAGSLKEHYKNELSDRGILFEEGGHSQERISWATEVVKSPGIPDRAPMVQAVHAQGLNVISEIEFAARFTSAILIGITGTNGKTTTTSLIYHILKKAGFRVGLGGNIGKSFARQVAENDFDHYVLELSSFQLDGMYNTHLHVAVLCNITPDHLDRYDGQLERYVQSKFRIVQQMGAADYFIYCYDDPITRAAMQGKSFGMHCLPFSIGTEVNPGAFLLDKTISFNLPNQPFTMSIQDLALQGKHNAYNSMAAGIAARVLEIRKETIRESLSDFENIEHRLEFVAKVNGIAFINDSKATNVNSTWYALESMQEPTVWIVGGQDKGNDYDMLLELVKEKVKAIVCLGKDNQKLIEAFGGLGIDMVETQSAEAAVKAAYRLGKKGDTVLLSPACASFDLFDNYEDRGRQFKITVRSL